MKNRHASPLRVPEQWDVLIIDDEPDSLDLIATILRYHGIRCMCAATAGEALDYLQQGYLPTLILVDLLLPEVDGWSLFTQLSHNPHLNSVPRVAMTAYHTPMVANRAIQAGFDAFLPKPIDAMTLVEDLATILEDKLAKLA